MLDPDRSPALGRPPRSESPSVGLNVEATLVDEAFELNRVRVAGTGFDLAEGSVAAQNIWPVGRRGGKCSFEAAARNWAASSQDTDEGRQCCTREHDRLRLLESFVHVVNKARIESEAIRPLTRPGSVPVPRPD